MPAPTLFDRDFVPLGALLRAHASERPDAPAIVDEDRATTYRELDALADRVATALRRDGVDAGDGIAICAGNSLNAVAVILGAVRANVIVCPFATSLQPDQLERMFADCEAKALFLDAATASATAGMRVRGDVRCIGLDEHGSFDAWLPDGSGWRDVAILPDDPFNIIYSSGTTGAPKGIVQSHVMRWRQILMIRRYAMSESAVMLLSTPLYSNTTLAALFPTIACGGCAVLLRKFEADRFLEAAQARAATHAMLVPVQYRRIMDVADFDRFDLSAFVMKFSAAAPFAADLKADVLARWPGGLVELYGATEGGGLCVLEAHAHPDKLATVGRPHPGHDIRLVRDDDTECGPGEDGEVVGRSGAMMQGYFKAAHKTADAEWYSPAGLRYLRMGDLGRFDEDGFLTIVDRKKDMIISGGFNVYPSDVEAVLASHPAVLEAAVIGAPSRQWGETPVAFVALRDGAASTEFEIAEFVEARIGRMQRPSAYRFVDALPRSGIGKVLKRDLVQRLSGEVEPTR